VVHRLAGDVLMLGILAKGSDGSKAGGPDRHDGDQSQDREFAQRKPR
jgi:hypothetical protein